MNLIPVTAKFDILSPDRLQYQVEAGLTLLEIAQRAEGVPDIFFEKGTIAVDGYQFPPEAWGFIRPKLRGRRGAIIVTLHLFPEGGGKKVKNIALTVAAIAIVAGTAFIGAGGLAAIGLGSQAAFGAGTLGASLAAAGFGIAGQLALTALAPPPLKSNDTADKAPSVAGITGNVVQPLEPLPAVLGRMLVSPPLIIPPYTELSNQELTVVAVVGLVGRYDISDILLNGASIEDQTGIEYETRDGAPNQSDLTLITETRLERAGQIQLTNFVTKNDTTKNDQLIHQDDPDSDLPKQHIVRGVGTGYMHIIRFFWPGGIFKTNGGDPSTVPIRVDFRIRGTMTWTIGPTFHFSDQNGGKSFRQEIRFKHETPPPIMTSLNTDLFAYGAYHTTGDGQTFEYNSDNYFLQTGVTALSATDVLPLMTGATTSGVTMSSSSAVVGREAWRCAQSSPSIWESTAAPTVGSPQWIKVDFGASSHIVRSVQMVLTGNTAFGPKDFTIEGSNDDTNWDVLATITDYDWPTELAFVFQLYHSTSYRYYRIHVTETNTPSNAVRILSLNLYTGTSIAQIISGTRSVSSEIIQAYAVDVHEDGFDVFLDPAIFPEGDYEFRVQRGLAFDTGAFEPQAYTYGGNAANADWFVYRTVSGNFVVRTAPLGFTSDTILEKTLTYDTAPPLNVDGVAMIALRARNAQIETLSAIFESVVPIYSGGVWITEEATRNPAALFRHVLLGRENALSLPGEIIDEENLQDWYDFCVVNDYQCNAVVQGLSVEQVLQMIAASGFAVPRQNDKWGVIIERDTSGDPVVQKFTPLNSRNFEFSIDFPELPHALRTEFFDEHDDYRAAEEIVFMDGWDADSATLIDSIRYEGFTDVNKVQERARLDLGQLYFRRARYTFEIGIEHLVSMRGDLVGLNHDVISKFHGYSIVESVQTGGGFITGLTLESAIDFSLGQGDIDAIEDLEDLTDLTDIDVGMAISLRKNNQQVVTIPVNELVETNVITFVTPIALDANIVAGCLVGGGLLHNVETRCRIFSIEPFGDLLARITCVDEAPEIHHLST